MISFLLCLAILIAGYFFYGKVVENTFGPDDRETPAVRINDGVDYVVLPQRCPVGAHRIPVDHLRHHLCRRRPRLFLRYAVRAE